MEEKGSEEAAAEKFPVRVMEQENEDHNNMLGQNWCNLSVSLQAPLWQIFHYFYESCVQTGIPINISMYWSGYFKDWVFYPLKFRKEREIKTSITRVAIRIPSKLEKEGADRNMRNISETWEIYICIKQKRSGSVKALGYLGNQKQLH